MNAHRKWISRAWVTGLLLAFSTLAVAAHPGRSMDVDGVTVHLGIVPSAVLADHPDQLPPGHVLKTGKNVYHLLVALFDTASGERITDASVKARVAPMSAGAIRRTLDPVLWSGYLTYCNYFKMKPEMTYTVQVDFSRPEGVKGTAEFMHRPFDH